MSILYVDCIKFPINQFVGNLCPIKYTREPLIQIQIQIQKKKKKKKKKKKVKFKNFREIRNGQAIKPYYP
jgi:hypothetical protein